MRKGFKEMWWHARLYARVLKTLFVAFACLAAMCKGFKGNVYLIPLCGILLFGNVPPCPYEETKETKSVQVNPFSEVQ